MGGWVGSKEVKGLGGGEEGEGSVVMYRVGLHHGPAGLVQYPTLAISSTVKIKSNNNNAISSFVLIIHQRIHPYYIFIPFTI